MPPGRKKNKKAFSELSPLEMEFMRIIWERGNATAAEIKEILKSSHPLADTTVHTILANMRKKNYIKPIPTVERALRFAPQISRDIIAGNSLRRVLWNFFGGSPKRLMAYLLKEEKVDEREMAEIRQMLKTSNSKGGKKS
jgi:BlaI family penicillinase repressor